MKNNLEFWLNEIDAQGFPEFGDAQGPTSANAMSQTPDAPAQGIYPNIPNQNAQQQPDAQQQQPKPQQPQDDVSNDPQAPHMPEEKPENKDFESWKHNFIKESIKCDTNKMMELLLQVRGREGLNTYQNKFIEDNWSIQLIRQNANVDKASRQIRNEIRKQLDKNNPSTSLINYITAVLETVPTLNNVFIKLNGYSGMKGDLHRKYIAALLGAVQVGNGANNEDLKLIEREYVVNLSTRFNANFGNCQLANWSLREDDAERFLSEPELKKLQEGSPEEKIALRHRIIVESMAQLFEERAFLINVVGEDGTIYGLGWDISSSLRAAFTSGKLVVKTRTSDNSEATIDNEGNIISIKYVKETGGQDEDGKPQTEDKRFLERKDGMLFLVADLQLMKEVATALQGISFKNTPYTGNPSDLKQNIRCVYSAADLILRVC